MKRMHLHVSVKNIDESINFYRRLFAAEPTVRKSDYAKWMLDDPRVNFAISTRSAALGLDHLGIQVETDEELNELEQRAARAGLAAQPEAAANCCYAQSNKHWLADPQGVVWEVFHTLGEIPVYGGERPSQQACCTPSTKPVAQLPERQSCGANSNCC